METENPAPPRQSVAIGVVAAVLAVASTAVCLRLYTRYALLRSFDADDWAVAIAYLFTLACGISIAVGRLIPVHHVYKFADEI